VLNKSNDGRMGARKPVLEVGLHPRDASDGGFDGLSGGIAAFFNTLPRL
jgi:hypothetical protein